MSSLPIFGLTVDPSAQISEREKGKPCGHGPVDRNPSAGFFDRKKTPCARISGPPEVGLSPAARDSNCKIQQGSSTVCQNSAQAYLPQECPLQGLDAQRSHAQLSGRCLRANGLRARVCVCLSVSAHVSFAHQQLLTAHYNVKVRAKRRGWECNVLVCMFPSQASSFL